MTDDDPLEGADIGESATVTRTEEIWLGDLEADAARGSDRLSDPSVTDVEVVTDDWGDEVLRVTVESDVTKRLPRRWDTCQDPRTDSERQTERRKRWGRHAVTIGTNLAVVGLVLAVGVRMMNSMAGELVVNGEPLSPIAWPAVGTVVLLAIVVVVGIQYLPRPGPGVGR